MSFVPSGRCQLTSCFKRRRLLDEHDLSLTINEYARRKFTNASCVATPRRSQILDERNIYYTTQRPQWNVQLHIHTAKDFQSNIRPFSTTVCAGGNKSSSTKPHFAEARSTRPVKFCLKRWKSSTVTLPEPSMVSHNNMHRAAVAFGSNIGDRITYIEEALASLKAHGLKILKLSRLYETAPMYYQNQDSFLNGVVLVETELSPIALLDLLQRIEAEQGRRREIAKGPRTLDLDIALYGEELIDVDRLKVPHPGLLEREFVLRPLADVIPNHRLRPFHQTGNADGTVRVETALTAVTNHSEPMYPIIQISPSLPTLVPSDPKRRTRLMSILNITPDSFSDGGFLTPHDLDTLTETVQKHISSGATILDIGGQSTRPNAPFLSASEELDRVLPVLRHIKDLPEAKSVAISLDTFHAEVAKACAAENLIDIINDVSAGQMDKDMLRVMADSRCAVVLMHMRGTPSTMTKLTDYPGGVVKDVAEELSQRVTEALDAGIPPWRIILDPGIGFAKTMEQNLELLRVGTDAIVKQSPDILGGYPWLVGTSRKGFIGKITGVKEAKERVWGTAACVSAAVAGGADIVRVHDVTEMQGVVAMADAIYRAV